jgi:hypothetical protein
LEEAAVAGLEGVDDARLRTAIAGFGRQVNLRESVSVLGVESVTLRTILPLPLTVPFFLSLTTKRSCGVQAFAVAVGMRASRLRSRRRRLSRAFGSLCGLAASLVLGFLKS